MRKDVVVVGRRVSIRHKPEDAAAKLSGVAAKVAAGKKLTDEERDALLVALAQKAGIL